MASSKIPLPFPFLYDLLSNKTTYRKTIEEEWQDIDNNIDSLTTDFASESLSANTIAARLERILRAIHTERWTMRDFLAAFVQETNTTGRKIMLSVRGYRSLRGRRNTFAG